MDWISSLLLATVRLAIPLLLISLAELYGQRAGMVNIGLWRPSVRWWAS